MAIRALARGDLEAAAQIVAECTDGNVQHQLDLLERRLEGTTPDSALLVAETESRVVGVARAAYFEASAEAPTNAAPPGWYLLGVNVLPSYRRRGIGRALTVARLKLIQAHAPLAWYFTEATNEASIRLHAALGFRENTRDFWFPSATFGAGGGILFSARLRD